MQEKRTVPFGYCHCGCGAKTPLYQRGHKDRGQVKGQPAKWLVGHHLRTSPVDYIVDPGTGCWVWQRARLPNGYPRGIQINGKTGLAHRVFYEREFGPIPLGLDLDHLCKNPGCVNPSHLEPVTRTENTRRGSRTKLSMEKAREIRASMDAPKVLAARYGVSLPTIYQILRGEKWREGERRVIFTTL